MIGLLVTLGVWLLTMTPPVRRPFRIAAERIMDTVERLYMRESLVLPAMLLMSFAVVAIPVASVWLALSWIGVV